VIDVCDECRTSIMSFVEMRGNKPLDREAHVRLHNNLIDDGALRGVEKFVEEQQSYRAYKQQETLDFLELLKKHVEKCSTPASQG